MLSQKLAHYERVGQHLATKVSSPSCSHTPNKNPPPIITALPDQSRNTPEEKQNKAKSKDDAMAGSQSHG